MEFEHIEARIKEGTIIAVLDTKISSKEKGQRYFSGRWLKDIETAEKEWEYMKKEISKQHEIEIVDKYYTDIDRSRRELRVGYKK